MAEELVPEILSGKQMCSLQRSEREICSSEVAKRKLSHKHLKAVRKKERRKSKRKQAAQKRDAQTHQADATCDSTFHRIRRIREEEQEKYEEECCERQRQLQHTLWIERERLALQQIAERKRQEEIFAQKQEEEERRIREEWQERQQREKEEQKEREEKEKAKKDKKEALMREARSGEKGKDGGSWHNPLAPANYCQEQEVCPFFAKTGACRYGERCSRAHPFPNTSCTLLFRGMYAHFSLMEGLQDEFDLDITLEYEDRETYQHFRDFYDDVLPELRAIGKVVQFKVCCNYEPHLRGNVYIQYRREEDAHLAFVQFNARWYAGRQLQCEFCSVTRWKNAICGQFRTKKCPKGKNCNFLHVFRNPDGEFWEADRDYDLSEPRSDRHYNWSRRSSLPRDRPRLPNWDRQRSARRSRSRSPDRRKRRRSRSPSRRSTRPRSRSRSRSRSPKEERSARSHRSARKSRSRSPHRASSRSKGRESRTRSRTSVEGAVGRTDSKWDTDSESDDADRDNRSKQSFRRYRIKELSAPSVNGSRHASLSPSEERPGSPERAASRSSSPEDRKHKHKKHKKHKHSHHKKNGHSEASAKKRHSASSAERAAAPSQNCIVGIINGASSDRRDGLDTIQKHCIEQIKDCIEKAKRDSLCRDTAQNGQTPIHNGDPPSPGSPALKSERPPREPSLPCLSAPEGQGHSC